MDVAVAMLALFVLRLAFPVIALLAVGEWLSRREDAPPPPQKEIHSK